MAELIEINTYPVINVLAKLNKLNNLDVYGYLVFLLSELPKLGTEPTEDQIKPYLPWSDQLPDYCKNQSKI